MDFVDEINTAIDLGLEEFKVFIDRKINANKAYLEQLFWLPNGSQMTVLNYLIGEHQEIKEGTAPQSSTKDLSKLIDYILQLSRDVNIGQPLHQAIATGKIRLALHLLQSEHIKIEMQQEDNNESTVLSIFNALKQKAKEIAESIRIKFFDVDRRDEEGRTLISLVLNTKHLDLLFHLLLQEPNIHASTRMTNAKIKFQPIHQAVVLDFADGVSLLAHEGADLSNPLGVMRDTPLSLAARLGKINALQALLELPIDKLALESQNKHLFEDMKIGYTAMDELCNRIANNTDKSEALRGVAMLLCCGAEPPRNEAMRRLLSSNRVGLLKAVHAYLEHKPELVDPFVTRCHLAESALHNILFANHSWGSSIRHLFGQPSEGALIIEDLVIRKYFNRKDGNTPATVPAEDFLKEKDPLKLYAAFVQLYNKAYESQLIPNRWSTMRWMIAEGRGDWETVLRYSENHPTSRTRIIIHEMFNPVPTVHKDVKKEQPPEQVGEAVHIGLVQEHSPIIEKFIKEDDVEIDNRGSMSLT